MSITRRLLAAILAALLIAGAVGFLVVTQVYRTTVEAQASDRLSQASRSFNSLIEQDLNKLAAAADLVALEPAVADALAKSDRGALLQLSEKPFLQFKKSRAITHWYYLETPEKGGRVLLRVHRPTKYGDALDRDTYRLAVTTGQGRGLDLGRTAFALRYIRPVTDANGTPIGYVEMGEEISSFLKRLSANDGFDYAMLIDKGALPAGSESTWKSIRESYPMAGAWDLNPTKLLVDGTSSNPYMWPGNPRDLPHDGEVLRTRNAAGRTLVDGAFPVHSASGEVIGCVVVTQDVTDLIENMRTAQVSIVGYIGVAMALLGGLILIVIQNFVLAPLSATATEVDGLASRVARDADDLDYEPSLHGDDQLAYLQASLRRLMQAVSDAKAGGERRNGR